MRDLEKLAIKLFAEPGESPALSEFIPVFHRWIQTGALGGVLVDVADYSHVRGGPGILLVAHEANYAVDEGGGRRGLLYTRKQTLPGDLVDRIISCARDTLRACRLLEESPELGGRLRFRGDEVLLIANDRLIAPNTDETFAAIREPAETFLKRLWGDAAFSISREPDSKERFSITARLEKRCGIGPLLERLGG